MIYIVWFAGDHPDSFDWFHIVSTKKKAMKIAEGIAGANNQSVKYLPHKSNKSLYDFDATTAVVVQQTDHYFFGA